MQRLTARPLSSARLRRYTRQTLFALALCLVVCAPTRADELNVAVAANFLGTLQQLATVFKEATGHTLVITRGATGQLYAQIQQGAPFDVLLSADSERPAQLEQEKLAVKGTRFTYAQGKLVLYCPQLTAAGSAEQKLKRRELKFVAIANPKTAPYGAAAERVLKALGQLEYLQKESKLVTGESVSQTYEFAASGNADCAFVAQSQVTKPKTAEAGQATTRGATWQVPAALYGKLDQDAVVLSHSPRVPLARKFLDWLRGNPAALAIIKAAGYGVPKR